VVDDGDVTRNEFCTTKSDSYPETKTKEQDRRGRTVFQNAPIGQINPAPFISDDNDCPTKCDVPAKPHVTGDGEMVTDTEENGGKSKYKVCRLMGWKGMRLIWTNHI